MIPENVWTYGYRRPTANRIFRVLDWSGSWQDAKAEGTTLAERHPALRFYLLTTKEYDDTHPSEDSHNFLECNGRRIRIADVPTFQG